MECSVDMHVTYGTMAWCSGQYTALLHIVVLQGGVLMFVYRWARVPSSMPGFWTS